MAQRKIYRAVIARIAKAEGGKSQVRVGDVRQIVGILADVMFANRRIKNLVQQMGYDRAKAKAKKRNKAA